MNLHEYQSKQLLNKYNITIPIGYVCSTAREIKEATLKIGHGPWIVKCQVHAGGRSKSGGVKIISSKEEAYDFAEYWLGKRLVTYQTNNIGQLVTKILIEQVTEINKEFYISVIIDRNMHKIVFMASNEGGIEIEKIAEKTPSLIHKVIVDLSIGPSLYQGREIALKLGLNKNINQFSNIFVNLITLFIKYDLSLLEINPLVLNKEGNLVCLDSKFIVDNNALFRQIKLRDMMDYSQEDEQEINASKYGLNYLTLNGNIGFMANGAGLAMGTMDSIKLYGGMPANFLDIGGNITKERVEIALKILLSNKKIKIILINIFGGIVCCDLIAEGIIQAINKIKINIPIIIRLEGNNSKLGIKNLINSHLNIQIANNFKNAIEMTINKIKE